MRKPHFTFKKWWQVIAVVIVSCFAGVLWAHNSSGLALIIPNSTITVTSAADTGAGSLREALDLAKDGDIIEFSTSVFPPANPSTIFLYTELPYIDVIGLMIDGSNAGVIINGSNMPESWNDCLIIQNASNITIRGLQFISCRDHAIEVLSNVTNLTVGGDRTIGNGPIGQGNRFAMNKRAFFSSGSNIQQITLKGNIVGTNLQGSIAEANSDAGITIRDAVSVSIGGETSGESNLISGNGFYGLEIWNSSDINIIGNYIGTNLNGTAAIGNVDSGVLVVDSSSVIFNHNLVSGNGSNGAFFDRVNTITVKGNSIGTDATGDTALPNNAIGLGIKGTDITIGGEQSGEGNLISGNKGWAGLQIESSSGLTTVVIKGNTIGTNLAGNKTIGNLGLGIYVNDSNLTLGGITASEGNLVAGNGDTGIVIESKTDTPYTANIIGNTIGTNRAGTVVISNAGNGIQLNDVGKATIKNNLISGSGNKGWAGLHVQGIGNDNAQATIQNNIIGLDITGNFALPNEEHGVYAQDINIIIGGNQSGEGNLISSNHGSGIQIENRTALLFSATIIGNKIGTNVDGNQKLGNTFNGVYLQGMGNLQIENNLISNNGENGININGKSITSAFICQNKIGTDITGTLDFGNIGNGIWAEFADLTIGDGDVCLPNLISGNNGSGIATRGNSSLKLIVRGNKIGTDISGQKAIGQGGDGVLSQEYDLFFGGPNPGDGNLVSGNFQTGLVITGTLSADIQNNYFGTNTDGTKKMGNSWNGITLNRTQNAQINNNLISGNTNNGIALETGAFNNNIYNNKIGTDASGEVSLGNNERGIVFFGGASNNSIFSNLISGNNYGIVIHDLGTDHNKVYGNVIGLDISGQKILPNARSGIIITEGSSNTIGGLTQAERNIISGNGEFGIVISQPGATNNIIVGNYIGLNQTGSAVWGNAYAGIALFDGASSNRIGGNNLSERNIISGNHEHGINIGGKANQVINNYIGTDPDGSTDFGNGKEGIVLHIPNNGIQGENKIVNNLVSGNDLNGISIFSDKNIIQGNIVGTNAGGQTPLGNSFHGIYISGSQNTIGGNEPNQGNLVSGNGNNGVSLGIDRDTNGNLIRFAKDNLVQGNYLGTNSSGNSALANQWAGVYIAGTGNLIGGTSTGQGNLISGNHHEGVILGDSIYTTNNNVQGNRIGTDYTGNNPVPNSDDGVSIWSGVGHNTIGGETSNAGNIVAFNHDLGIAKWQDSINGEGVGNLIANNIIHHNDGVGLRITMNTSLMNNNIYANGENRIELPAGTIQGSNQTWSVQGQADSFFVHYSCATCEFVIANGTTLLIKEGVKVYLDYNRTLTVQGTLNTQGTETKPVRITGPHDSIWSGDWKGIIFTPGSQGDIRNTDITFAQIGINIEGAVTLADSTVSGHKQGGIRVTGNGSLKLSNNTFGGNYIDPYNQANTAYDISNETQTLINANGSWWGQVSGPISSRVKGKVDTTNWRKTEGQTNSWQSAELLQEGSHQFFVSGLDDLDWYRIPIMDGNRTLRIELSNLPVDYDIFLFGQLGGAVKYTEDIARRIMHISRIMHTEETQAIYQLSDIARLMHIGQYASNGEGLDTGQLLRASTNPGNNPDSVEFNVGNQVGWYYFLIAGNNGANSDISYSLKVSTEYNPTLGKENYYVPVFPPLVSTSAANTLIITNRTRLEKRYGSSQVQQLFTDMQLFAENPLVNGEIVDVSNCDSLFSDWKDCNKLMNESYDEWDINLDSIYYSNRVAATVKSLLESIRTSYPDLKYIVIVGNDEIIPHWRVFDESPIGKERSYEAQLLRNQPIGAALSQGFFLTDDFFTQFEPISWHGRELYIPTYAIGRLVETPDQISSMIEAFKITPNKAVNEALITGYDFLKDQANKISDELSSISTDKLINDYWTTVELTNTWFSRPSDFVSLNAHFSHFQAIPGSLDPSKPLLPQQIREGLFSSEGSLVYSVGCHSGLSVPKGQATGDYDVDFSEVFAEKGINFISSSGFGYGDAVSIAYSESLSIFFIRQLKSGLSIGEALAQAKNDYYRQTGVYSFSPYDEKVLEETILFGLPMYTYQFSSEQKIPNALEAKATPCNLVLSTPFNDLTTKTLNCSFTMTPIITSLGSYYAINDQIEANIGQPIQPRTNIDITLSGNSAHGVFVESGTYETFQSFDPVITRVITDSVSYNPSEPLFNTPVWTPSSWDVINSIRTQNGIDQQLVLIPAQYKTETGITGIERTFKDLTYSIYYSNSEDGLPPFIWKVEIERRINDVNIIVTVFDRSDIVRVGVTHTSHDGTWTTVNLSKIDTSHWGRTIPITDDLHFFVQALDGAGNVAVADNKGSYYSPPSKLFLPLISR
jgi:hypothetical protein